MNRLWAAAALWVAGGCNLIGTNVLSTDYAFDPQEYKTEFANLSNRTVPVIACDPASSTDACAAPSAQLAAQTGVTLTCDGKVKQCVGTAEVRLSYVVDLSAQTTFPPEAIQYGINAVSIKKIEYWVVSNTLNTAVPPIDIYVASAAAKDETMGTKLGSVAMLPSKSNTCGDPSDPSGDPKAGAAPVCDLPVSDAGQAQLAAFAKDYKNKFQVLAHTLVTVQGGQPLPDGMLDFVVRPVVSIGILK